MEVQLQMEVAQDSGFLLVRHDRIVRFEQQPRTFFSEQSINELADSIEERGQKTPVQLSKTSGGKKHPPKLDADGKIVFTLIDGERRWRACSRLAERTKKPFLMKATVEIIDDIEEHFERSFGANFGTEEMPPLDTAAGLLRLKNNGATHEKLAKSYSRSMKFVVDYLSLNNLHQDVKDMMDPSLPKDQRLGVTHAVQIARVKDSAMQLKLAEEALELGLTVGDIKLSVESSGLTNLTYTPQSREDSYQPRQRVSDGRAIFSNMITAVEKKLGPYAKRLEAGDLDLEAMYDSCFEGDNVFKAYLKKLRSAKSHIEQLEKAVEETLRS